MNQENESHGPVKQVLPTERPPNISFLVGMDDLNNAMCEIEGHLGTCFSSHSLDEEGKSIASEILIVIQTLRKPLKALEAWEVKNYGDSRF